MTDFNALESLFFAVLERAPADRAAFLDEACRDNPELRASVERLLGVQPQVGGFLEQPAAETASFARDAPPGETTATHSPTEAIGAVLAGKFKLTERIGEGGMGSVWLAQQSEPVKRKVAVKFIKPGMDSKQVLARFEQERQALAVMDHPNIAKVLDGGLHDGRPFFVMELVKGVPITQFCDERKLTPRERLELFVPVCLAIQHAHQKGVIHRDIKPSNVLIALYDDKPVPKVIDFGVAKAIGGTLTEHTIETGFGGVVGTPQYMSPEQATLNNLDIDTRSDVYSLGVLLYELLTGSPPFARKELEIKGLLELLRVVREEEPPKPSTKLSTADSLPTLSANRGTEPKKLTALLRSELDWVVMKALEKDRRRRYETANGFAADIIRYLAGEPVTAHPPSAAYRLRKFLRRHRPEAIAASLTFLLLIAGIVGTTLGLVEARQGREAAETARREAVAERDEREKARSAEETQRKQAEAEKQRADVQAAIARAVNEFLQEDLLLQAASEFQAAQGHTINLNLTVREAVDRAAGRVGERFRDKPMVEAEVRQVVGVAYKGLGDFRQAIPHCERAVALYESHSGPVHADTLNAMTNLARTYHQAGRVADAIALYERVLVRAKGHPEVDGDARFGTKTGLALAYAAAGRHGDALPLQEELLARVRVRNGSDHPVTLTAMSNLAIAYTREGRTDEAVALQEEVLRLRKARFGGTHPATLTAMNHVAYTYQEAGRPEDALRLHAATLELRKTNLGDDHPDTLTSLHNLAWAHADVGRVADAIPLFEAALRARTKKLDPNHPLTKSTRQHLEVVAKLGERTTPYAARLAWAATLRELERFDSAVASGRMVVTARRRLLGDDHPDVAVAQAELGLTQLMQKKFADAEPLLRQCHATRTKTQPDAWTRFEAEALLGGALLGQKKYADAEPFLLKGYEGMKAREKSIPPQSMVRIAETLDRLIDLDTATNKPTEVVKWRAERAKYPAEQAPRPRAVK